RSDVGRKGGTAVVGAGVVSAKQPEKLQLCIPDCDTGLPLDRRPRWQGIESRIARRGVVDQVGLNSRIAFVQAIIRSSGGAAAGPAVVDFDIYSDLVGNRRGQDRCRLLYARAETCRRRHRCRVEQEIDGNAAAGRLGDDGTGATEAILGTFGDDRFGRKGWGWSRQY